MEPDGGAGTRSSGPKMVANYVSNILHKPPGCVVTSKSEYAPPVRSLVTLHVTSSPKTRSDLIDLGRAHVGDTLL